MKASLAPLAIGLLTQLANAAAAAGAAPDCSRYQNALGADQQKYQSEFKSDQDQSDQMKGDSVALGGDVTWSDQTIIFNVPSVTVRNQKLIFGVPQVAMNNQHVIFDTPTVTMVNTKIGQYPETTCTDTWINLPFNGKTKGIPNCTVSWHDIITKVPQTSMQRQDILMGIPEFKWDNTQIIVGVPEFTSQQVKWIIGLPQFTVKSIVINAQKVQDESNAIQNDVAAKKADMAKDVGGDIHAVFSCYRSSVSAERASTLAQFDASLTQMDGAIQNLKNIGADPTNINDGSGSSTNLVAKRASVATQRDASIATFDATLNSLDASEHQAINQLSS